MTYRRVEILKVCLSVMLERLVHGDPATLDELSEVSGVHRDIVRKHLKPLMNRELVFIPEWVRNGKNQHYIPTYQFTTTKQKSVPKPRNLTAIERANRSKERKQRAKALKAVNIIVLKPQQKEMQNEI
jgi:predicted ArsR family transcriptional regulator